MPDTPFLLWFKSPSLAATFSQADRASRSSSKGTCISWPPLWPAKYPQLLNIKVQDSISCTNYSDSQITKCILWYPAGFSFRRQLCIDAGRDLSCLFFPAINNTGKRSQWMILSSSMYCQPASQSAEQCVVRTLYSSSSSSPWGSLQHSVTYAYLLTGWLAGCRRGPITSPCSCRAGTEW